MILDVCCGRRMMWFNKARKDTIYCDIRNSRDLRVLPDVQCSFEALPFKDSSFELVVFDPPHLYRPNPEKFKMGIKYGCLPRLWESMLYKGFAECMRVLRPEGSLIFKWSDKEIKLDRILHLLGEPLFGSRTSKNTLWMVYRHKEAR